MCNYFAYDMIDGVILEITELYGIEIYLLEYQYGATWNSEDRNIVNAK